MNTATISDSTSGKIISLPGVKWDQISRSLPAGHKLNIGCGDVQPAGWVNIDNSNRAKLSTWLGPLDRLLTACRVLKPSPYPNGVKVANLLKRWPFPDGSCAAIYAGDVYEHFTFEQTNHLTREAFRVLAPGGVLRLRVPDGELMWRNYLAAVDKARAAAPGNREAELAEVRRHVWMYFRDLCIARPYLRSMGHFHKWHWDEVQLCELLHSCGFQDVRRRGKHDSRIEDVALVEHWDYLQVEGIKPVPSS
jgi:predicted SAM-dependent methyltransferase